MAAKKKTPTRRTPSKKTVAQLRSEAQAEAKTDPAILKVEQEKRDSVLKTVAELNVESSLQDLATTGMKITESLTTVSAELQQKVAELKAVNEAIVVKQQELERLNGVDVVSTAIRDLIAEHDAKVKLFIESEKERDDTWMKADAERAIRIAEEDEERTKRRTRDEADYKYNLAIQRKRDQDEFEEQIRVKQRAEQERQEALEKNWRKREEELAAKETTLQEALSKAKEEEDRIAGLLQKEVETALERARNSNNTTLGFLKKDNEKEITVRDLKISGLETEVSSLKGRISELMQEMKDKDQNLRDITVATVEGASGRKTLEEIKEMQRSQTQQQSGKGR